MKRTLKSTNKTCGMLYEIQTEVQTIPILHLYCGAYEMGRAQGTISLVKSLVKKFHRNVNEKSNNEFLYRIGRIHNWNLFGENSRLCKNSISNFGRDAHTEFLK